MSIFFIVSYNELFGNSEICQKIDATLHRYYKEILCGKGMVLGFFSCFCIPFWAFCRNALESATVWRNRYCRFGRKFFAVLLKKAPNGAK